MINVAQIKMKGGGEGGRGGWHRHKRIPVHEMKIAVCYLPPSPCLA